MTNMKLTHLLIVIVRVISKLCHNCAPRDGESFALSDCPAGTSYARAYMKEDTKEGAQILQTHLGMDWSRSNPAASI